MSNYAVIKNGIVSNIVVADADWADAQTDTVIEYTDVNPAHIRGDYVDGYFYPPKPFPSWIRDNGKWVAPVVRTSVEENTVRIWNEATLSWIDTNVDTAPTELPDEFID